MFTTIRSRLWLTYALVIICVLCVVIVGLFVYLVQNPLADRQEFAHLERVADLAINRFRFQPELTKRVDVATSRLDEIFDVRVLILSPDLSVLADSRQGSASGLNLSSVQPDKLKRGYTRDTDGNAWLFVKRQLTGGNYLIVVKPRSAGIALLLGQKLRNVWRDELLPPVLRAGGMALVLALLLAYWIAHWVSAPLQRIATAAERLSRGEFSKIEPEGPQEVKQLADVFNRMTEKVQSSQKSQREFVANVSHELKTPLTSIQGFSQAILDGTVVSQEELHNASAIILSESERMQRMVSNLLELARFDAGSIELKSEIIHLCRLLDSVIASLTSIAELSNIALNAEISDDLKILGDADRIFQVFSNLIDNAIKHSLPDNSVMISSRRSGKFALVSVSDYGSGIAPDEHERVFERFYQVDKSRKGGGNHGVGLGLSIVKEIVVAHHGSIHLEDNAPHGSTFVVKLPLA